MVGCHFACIPTVGNQGRKTVFSFALPVKGLDLPSAVNSLISSSVTTIFSLERRDATVSVQALSRAVRLREDRRKRSATSYIDEECSTPVHRMSAPDQYHNLRIQNAADTSLPHLTTHDDRPILRKKKAVEKRVLKSLETSLGSREHTFDDTNLITKVEH